MLKYQCRGCDVCRKENVTDMYCGAEGELIGNVAQCPISGKHDATPQIYRYLERLRDSGKINMYSAPRQLEKSLGLSSEDAVSVVSEWMDSFR